MLSKYHIWFSLAACFLEHFLAQEKSSTKGQTFARYKGIHYQSPCRLTKSIMESFSACVMWCHRDSNCTCGAYHSVRKTCCLSDVSAFDVSAVYETDDDSWYFQTKLDHISFNGWHLAFRVTGGSNVSLYDAWTNAGYHDDAPVGNSELDFGCMTLNGSIPCRGHFRSVYLDTWDSLNVQEVSLGLYDKGTNVVNVVFNGTGSTMTSWMTPSRILQTPWSDMTTDPADYNYFGINEIPMHTRYFFINQFYDGCHNDTGWVCAADLTRSERPPCPWEEHPYPALLYSTAPTATTWQGSNSSVALADVLAILIRF